MVGKPTKDYWALVKQRRFSKRDLIDIYVYCREQPEQYRLTPLLSCGLLDMRPLTAEEIEWAQKTLAPTLKEKGDG